jgi:hypothetical protein
MLTSSARNLIALECDSACVTVSHDSHTEPVSNAYNNREAGLVRASLNPVVQQRPGGLPI